MKYYKLIPTFSHNQSHQHLSLVIKCLCDVMYAGQVMIQSGDTGKGIEAFERAIQLAPDDENLLLSAAHHLR